jgi:tetratricopeptide (TPR) repeat protein
VMLETIREYGWEDHKALGEAETVLRMGAALALFWELHYSYHEGLNILSRALEASEDVAIQVRARGLVAAGWMALRLGHFEQAEILCQEGLALFRTIGDTAGMGHAVFHLAQSASERGDVVKARSLHQESIVLNREAGNPYGTAYALHVLALYAIFGPGDLPLSQGHLLAEESLALFRNIGSRNWEPYGLATLGEITFLQGDTTTARQLLEQSCIQFREVGNEPRIAWTLSLLGKVLATEGNLEAARVAYEESLILENRVNCDRSYLDYS